MVAVVFLSCAHDPVKDDLVVYVNDDLLRIVDLESAALARYHAVTGKNYKDDATLVMTLNGYVIPQYKRFLGLLRKIRPATHETQVLHRMYLQGVERMYDGFCMLRTALEKQDPVLFRFANEKITQGRETIERFTAELDGICEAHGLSLQRKGEVKETFWERMGFF